MIRTDNSRSIGLKKTLVFYSGKAPKGIRSSWIMNEYRLPHHETERLQKVCILFTCLVFSRFKNQSSFKGKQQELQHEHKDYKRSNSNDQSINYNSSAKVTASFKCVLLSLNLETNITARIKCLLVCKYIRGFHGVVFAG